MTSKVVVADTGPIISLALIGKIDLISKIFGKFHIATAVWEELVKYDHLINNPQLMNKLKNHVVNIHSSNQLSIIMDKGESESVTLYGEIDADYLLLDDQKARTIAESLGVNCIGSIAVLIKAKEKGFIKNLRSHFEIWVKGKRYFSTRLLNDILMKFGEPKMML